MPRPLQPDIVEWALVAPDEEINDAHRPRRGWSMPEDDQEWDAAHTLPPPDAVVPTTPPEAWIGSLMGAIGLGWDGVVHMLLAHGLAANAFSAETLNSALIAAVIHARLGVVQALVVAGAAVDTVEPGTLDTPLMIASETESLDIMAALLRAHALVDRSHPVTGNTALMSAIGAEQWHAVYLLLAHGADVNFPNPVTGCTALMLAQQLGLDAALQTELDKLAGAHAPPPIPVDSAPVAAPHAAESETLETVPPDVLETSHAVHGAQDAAGEETDVSTGLGAAVSAGLAALPALPVLLVGLVGLRAIHDIEWEAQDALVTVCLP